MEIEAAGWVEEFKCYIIFRLYREKDGSLMWRLTGHRNRKNNAYATLNRQCIERYLQYNLSEGIWAARSTLLKFEEGDI